MGVLYIDFCLFLEKQFICSSTKHKQLGCQTIEVSYIYFEGVVNVYTIYVLSVMAIVR